MSVEFLLSSYVVWSVVTTIVYLIVDEDGVTMAFYACCGSMGVALPFGLFLLLDGGWSNNDCLFIANILYATSLIVCVGRTGDWFAALVVRTCVDHVLGPQDQGVPPGARLCDDFGESTRDPMHPTAV